MAVSNNNENYIKCYNLNLNQKINLYNYMSTFVQNKRARNNQNIIFQHKHKLWLFNNTETHSETYSVIKLLIGKKFNCVKVHTYIEGLTKYK